MIILKPKSKEKLMSCKTPFYKKYLINAKPCSPNLYICMVAQQVRPIILKTKPKVGFISKFFTKINFPGFAFIE